MIISSTQRQEGNRKKRFANLGVWLVFLVLLSSSFGAKAARADFLLSEVMADAIDEAADEFVELVNIGPAPIDLSAWTISDNTSYDTLVDFTGPFDFGIAGLTIPTSGIVIIVDSQYAGRYGAYLAQRADPTNTILITTDDLTIGNGLGNTSDMVLLTDGNTTLRFSWTEASGNGISWENVDLLGNWRASTDGGSPGVTIQTVNAAPPPEEPFGQEISQPPPLSSESQPPNRPPHVSLEISQKTPTVGEIITFDATGSSDPDGDTLSFLWSMGDGRIAESDTVTHRYSRAGTFTVQLEASDGQSRDAATATLVVAVPQYAKTVRISEFLPNPEGQGSDKTDEFIELFNEGAEAIPLGGWILDDESAGGSSPWHMPDNTSIPPHGFVVFFRSDTGIALNNAGDEVRLLYPTEEVVDRQRYAEAQDGWSFARIGAQWAWTKSPTPGAENRIEKEEVLGGEEELERISGNESASEEDGDEEETAPSSSSSLNGISQKEIEKADRGQEKTARKQEVLEQEAAIARSPLSGIITLLLPSGIILLAAGFGVILVFLRRKFLS